MSDHDPDTLAGQMKELREAVLDARDELLASLPYADRETIAENREDISLFESLGEALAPVVCAHIGVVLGAFAGYQAGLGREPAVVVGLAVGLVFAAVAVYVFRGFWIPGRS